MPWLPPITARSALPVLLALVLAAGGDARAGDGVELSIGGDLRAFGYRELDANGRELDREEGLLPGLRVGARSTRDRMFGAVEASLHGGTVDHDGETRGGAPVRTETDAELFAVSARLGRWFGPRAERWGGFLHFARRQWDRDIRSSGGVQGLFEEYRWSELGLGVRHVLRPAAGDAWGHEISGLLFAVIDGDVFVELSRVQGRDWDDTTLSLGSEQGLRLRYIASRRLSAERLLRISPYIAYWEFGRSETRAVTSDGSDTGVRVTEPRSESVRVGVSVDLVF